MIWWELQLKLSGKVMEIPGGNILLMGNKGSLNQQILRTDLLITHSWQRHVGQKWLAWPSFRSFLEMAGSL